LLGGGDPHTVWFMQPPPDPPIRHVAMSEVICYRLQKHELDTLSKGGGGSTMLAFGTGFLFSSLSFVGCVLSGPVYVTPPRPAGLGAEVILDQYVPARVIILIVLAAVCGALGVLLLILWWGKRGEVKKLLDEIHAREQAGGNNPGTNLSQNKPSGMGT
jgi:hypothetical protein